MRPDVLGVLVDLMWQLCTQNRMTLVSALQMTTLGAREFVHHWVLKMLLGVVIVLRQPLIADPLRIGYAVMSMQHL